MQENFRLEKDSLGSIEVPNDALWGAQTQRSLKNFYIGDELVPIQLIYAITLIKKASAIANFNLGYLEKFKKELIVEIASEILKGNYDNQFPLKIWQTGSGTQTNMNVNEVISNIASLKTNSKIGNHYPLHPNDDVNKSQSTNDTFPTAIHISVVKVIHRKLLPAVDQILIELNKRSKEWQSIIKIGRTHFQDAVPISFGQEISCWEKQLKDSKESILLSLNEILYFYHLVDHQQ